MGFWRNFYGVEESSWWIFSIEKYFRVNNIVEDEEKMKVVAMAMRGCALKWWLWRIRPHPSVSWNTFTEIFLWHFKPKWRHFFMELDEEIEEEEPDLFIEPTSTVEINHKQNHFIEDGQEEEDVELDLKSVKSIKKSSFLQDFVAEDESLKLKEDDLKESPKMYQTQLQQVNLTMKHGGEEESQLKLQLLPVEHQEEVNASGMNNKLAIWDKLEESKSQQSTMLIHLQEKLYVPSNDSSQIHNFLPTQHLATFNFTGTDLFVTSHHCTTTNSPYLSSPRSANKIQQPYFNSSLLLNIEAPFDDIVFHDKVDFAIPPRPPDSKDTTNKLSRPVESRRPLRMLVFPGGGVGFISEIRFISDTSNIRVHCYRILDDDGELMNHTNHVQVNKELTVRMHSEMVTFQGHPYQVTNNVFDDGDLVSPSSDCTLKRWRNDQCVETWEAHNSTIQAVIKLPTRELVTGSSDTTSNIWKVKTCLHTFEGHSDPVSGLAGFSFGNSQEVRVLELSSRAIQVPFNPLSFRVSNPLSISAATVFVIVFTFKNYNKTLAPFHSSHLNLPPVFVIKQQYKGYQLSIGAACRLSWPYNRINIQVLDDSTDPIIKNMVEVECERWRRKGLDLKYEIRKNRIASPLFLRGYTHNVLVTLKFYNSDEYAYLEVAYEIFIPKSPLFTPCWSKQLFQYYMMKEDGKATAAGGCIVNVSSRLSRLNGKRNRLDNDALKEKLSDVENLTEELIDGVVTIFLQQVEDGRWKLGGWPRTFTDYSGSKLAVNAYPRFMAGKLFDRPEGNFFDAYEMKVQFEHIPALISDAANTKIPCVVKLYLHWWGTAAMGITHIIFSLAAEVLQLVFII